MNVDIRIIMDIASGAADLYLSAKEDTFVVEVNRTSGAHVVSVDRKYGVGLAGDLTSATASSAAVSALRNGSDAPWLLRPRHATPAGLATYVTVRDPREFLLVRDLRHRLVVTVPQNVYDLRSTRLYLVISGASEEPTRGSLFFPPGPDSHRPLCLLLRLLLLLLLVPGSMRGGVESEAGL